MSAAPWPNHFSRVGTLWYQRRAALEAYQASLADYQQVVITAFQQVADSLRAVENDAQTLKAQTEALNAATQALQLVKANHQAGLVNYLQILTADNQYQQARTRRTSRPRPCASRTPPPSTSPWAAAGGAPAPK